MSTFEMESQADNLLKEGNGNRLIVKAASDDGGNATIVQVRAHGGLLGVRITEPEKIRNLIDYLAKEAERLERRPEITAEIAYGVDTDQIRKVVHPMGLISLLGELGYRLDHGCETLHNDERSMVEWRGYYAVRVMNDGNCWVDGPYSTISQLLEDQQEQDAEPLDLGDGRRLAHVVRIT